MPASLAARNSAASSSAPAGPQMSRARSSSTVQRQALGVLHAGQLRDRVPHPALLATNDALRVKGPAPLASCTRTPHCCDWSLTVCAARRGTSWSGRCSLRAVTLQATRPASATCHRRSRRGAPRRDRTPSRRQSACPRQNRTARCLVPVVLAAECRAMASVTSLVTASGRSRRAVATRTSCPDRRVAIMRAAARAAPSLCSAQRCRSGQAASMSSMLPRTFGACAAAAPTPGALPSNSCRTCRCLPLHSRRAVCSPARATRSALSELGLDQAGH
jgi:hypothetical protein